jgi:uncharacterized membrane-anchored protein
VSRLWKGLLLMLLQTAIVLSVAGKYYSDRTKLPRVWVQAAPFDPNLPIRGRYVRLRLLVEAPSTAGGMMNLSVEDGRLVAASSAPAGSVLVTRGPEGMLLSEPVAFFIPEHVADPSRRPRGEELWVEVSVPAKGPPRPIRLGVKKSGVLTPLDLN